MSDEITLPGEAEAKLAYTVKETASMLGLSPNSIYNLARFRGLPLTRIGRATRVLADDLRAFLASRPKVYQEKPE